MSNHILLGIEVYTRRKDRRSVRPFNVEEDKMIYALILNY